MSVIRRLKGVKFNNPSLPLAVFPGSFISDGLVAGYRLQADGLADLSGNGHTLETVSGIPTISGGYSSILPPAYYDTGISLGTEYTVIAVFRLPEVPNGNHYLLGDYSNSPDNAGLMFFSRTNNFAGLQLYSTDQPLGLYNGVVGPQVNGAFSMQVARVTSDKKASWMIPKVAYRNDKTFTGGIKVSPGTFKVGQTNVVSGTRPREIVEVLIYSRAMSDDEVTAQYEMSKGYSEKFGITDI